MRATAPCTVHLRGASCGHDTPSTVHRRRAHAEMVVTAVLLWTAGCQRGSYRSASVTEAQPSLAGGAVMTDNLRLAPATMPAIATVLDRFQSYNVEMLEVTGGRFWKPYGPTEEGTGGAAGRETPPGMDPDLYAYRPPIDLSNPRLRAMAAALGPAYVRVSGTWANTTYFAGADEPASPPEGFSAVLTARQWKGVVEFAKAADAEIVTSMAISPGTRDAQGVWKPDHARRWLAFTEQIGGRIAAAEYMNEPNAPEMGGAPAGYDAGAYGRDVRIFRAFVKDEAPDTAVLGPGSVGESEGESMMEHGAASVIPTRDLLAASGPGLDAFSYHHYGAASRRCSGAGMPQTSADAALSEEWLARTDRTLAFYRRLRDQLEPGRPIWLTETADAACGGNPWSATFLDTFRYLDQLGRLARQGVQTVMHNTLAASNYSLLDEETFAPKAAYWGALLWRRLMGTTVLDAGVPIAAGLHAYAHCLRDVPGGVALLLLNTSRTTGRTVIVPVAGERYTLAAPRLDTHDVRLNGRPLALGEGDALPALQAVATRAGRLEVAPATITFLAVPSADNQACR